MRTRGGCAVLEHAALLAMLLVLASCRPAAGQVFEAVGQRALGMAGAFVAVADDGTATYWNPAGLATGGLFDACMAYGDLRRLANGPQGTGPASDTAATSVCVAVPSLGFSYNRLRESEVTAPPPPTVTSAGDRQDLRLQGAGVSTLDTRQFGGTLVQSVVSGFVVGATVKYVRGSAAAAEESAAQGADTLLNRAADLAGRVSHAFDMDVGAMVSAGSFRAGVTVRNLFEPGFPTAAGAVLVLHRQARVGVAVTPGHEALRHASEDSWILALDADVTRTPTVNGDRRMVAAGAERWFAGHRVGLRGGVRVNTVGAARPVGAAGASVAVKKGVLIEAHVARGGQDADRGWGAGLTVGF